MNLKGNIALYCQHDGVSNYLLQLFNHSVSVTNSAQSFTSSIVYNARVRNVASFKNPKDWGEQSTHGLQISLHQNLAP